MATYLVFVLTVAGVYVLLAQSLVLAWGVTGMVNLGIVGFFAIGAYASAMVTKWGGLPVPVGLLSALVAAGLAGFLVVVSTLRLRDDYLAIVTLGFAEVVRIVAANEIWLTGGTDGISGIPSPIPRDLGLGFHALFLALVAALVAVVFVVLARLIASPWGRALRAVREDALVASVAGKPTARLKAQSFSTAAAIAGLAGAVYGHYTSYIAPDLFQPLLTIYVFLAATAGGHARPLGAVVGGTFVVLFMESTRFLAELVPGVGAVQAAALREIAIGVMLILVMRFRPHGLFPELSQKAPR